MSDGKDQFERWIDEGVRRYVAVEPPLGMESRVLAELEQHRQRRGWWRSWMIAIPAAAVLAVAVGLSLQEKTMPQRAVPQVSTAIPARPVPPVPPPRIVSRAPQPTRAVVARVATSASGREKFPTRSQPSEQEVLLARLARNSIAMRTVAAHVAKTPENIEISRVQIDPVEIPLLPGTIPGE